MPVDSDVSMDILNESYPELSNHADSSHLATTYEEMPGPVVPPEPLFTAAGRPQRWYRVPARYNDVPPEGPAPLIQTPEPEVPAPPLIRRVILHVRDRLRTGMNRFGLLREYPHRPSYDPDFFVPLEDLADNPALTPADRTPPPELASFAPPWPFKNMSIYLLMEWMTTGNN
jgi:hypothetical protein